MPDVYVNGKLTVTEITVDLGGVTLALTALQKPMEGQPPPGKIDGYSPEERFFVSWVQLWMTKIRSEVMRQMVGIDPHTPSQFLTTAPMVIMDEFFTTFDIQPGDVAVIEMHGQTLMVQSGSYLDSSAGIEVDTKWSVAKTFFGSEGLIMLKVSGTGTLIVSSYGAIHPIELEVRLGVHRRHRAPGHL